MVTLLSLTMNRLLLQLRDAALDENEPTAGLLRECLFLGSSIGSECLRRWAESELKGYSDEDELPAYRSIPAPINTIDGFTVRLYLGREPDRKSTASSPNRT